MRRSVIFQLGTSFWKLKKKAFAGMKVNLKWKFERSPVALVALFCRLTLSDRWSKGVNLWPKPRLFFFFLHPLKTFIFELIAVEIGNFFLNPKWGIRIQNMYIPKCDVVHNAHTTLRHCVTMCVSHMQCCEASMNTMWHELYIIKQQQSSKTNAY